MKGEELRQHLENLNSRRIIIRGLASNMTEKSLFEEFNKFGNIESAYIRKEPRLKLRTGIVLFKCQHEAAEALNHFEYLESQGLLGSIQVADHFSKFRQKNQQNYVLLNRSDAEYLESSQLHHLSESNFQNLGHIQRRDPQMYIELNYADEFKAHNMRPMQTQYHLIPRLQDHSANNLKLTKFNEINTKVIHQCCLMEK